MRSLRQEEKSGGSRSEPGSVHYLEAQEPMGDPEEINEGGQEGQVSVVGDKCSDMDT